MGLALASGKSVLEVADTGSIRHGRSFSQFLTEATPVGPRYKNLAMQTQYNSICGLSLTALETESSQLCAVIII